MGSVIRLHTHAHRELTIYPGFCEGCRLDTRKAVMHVICVCAGNGGSVILISWLSMEQQKVKTEQVMKLSVCVLCYGHRAAGQ